MQLCLTWLIGPDLFQVEHCEHIMLHIMLEEYQQWLHSNWMESTKSYLLSHFVQMWMKYMKCAYLEVHVPIEVAHKEEREDSVEGEKVQQSVACGLKGVDVLSSTARSPPESWISVDSAVFE